VHQERYHKEHLLPSFLQDVSFMTVGFMEQLTQPLRETFSVNAKDAVESAHKNWDVTSHLRSMSRDATKQHSADDVLRQLRPNLETFCDEYSLGRVKKKYPYKALYDDSNQVVGTSGVDGAYLEPLGALSERFQLRLNKTGIFEQRALLETFNSHRLEHWCQHALTHETIPVGTKLLWFSPPGHLIEGYHGVSPKHHSFIWVYEKKCDSNGPYIEMTQYRCWPNIKQLEHTQRQLSYYQQRSEFLDGSLPLDTPLTKRNKVIAEMFEVQPMLSESRIEEIIFASQKTWRVQPKHMPAEKLTTAQVSAFETQREKVLQEFLYPMYEKMLKDPKHQHLLQHSYHHKFWSSDRYRKIVDQLDIAFSLTKQSLDKWIERVLSGEAFTKIDITISELRELYELAVAQRSDSFSSHQVERYNRLAPALLSLGNRALSIGQCGLGTIVPVQLLRKISSSMSGSGPSMSGASVGTLTNVEKREFRKVLKDNYFQLTVLDREGAPHTFWVIKEHYHEYAGRCYQDENGIFRGPCDIPLDSGEDEFVLTNQKYQELLTASLEEKDEKAEQLKALKLQEQKELRNARTPQEKMRIKNKYQARREQIQSIGSFLSALTNLILMGTPDLIQSAA
jgi:hypothetical protein